jgi:hypothetical protein
VNKLFALMPSVANTQFPLSCNHLGIAWLRGEQMIERGL